MDKRREILLLDEVITADQTGEVKKTCDIRGITSMAGTYRLVVQTRDAGATAPTGAVSIVAQVQEADPDALVWVDVASFVNTAIAAVGDVVAYKSHAGVLSTKARVKITASAATSWGTGTRIKCWLIGEAA